MLLLYENQLVAVIGDVDADISSDDAVALSLSNYRIYFDEIQSFNYSSKKDGGHLVTLTANGMKHVFTFSGNEDLARLRDHWEGR